MPPALSAGRSSARRNSISSNQSEDAMRRLIATTVFAAATATAAGCGDNSSTSTAGIGLQTSVPVTATLQGSPLVGPVGSTVTVQVKVTDANNKIVAGAVINFVVTAGGGTIFAPAVQSSAEGLASEQWTLGPRPVAQTLE